MDADWLRGRFYGLEGIFPRAFVSAIQPLSAAEQANRTQESADTDLKNADASMVAGTGALDNAAEKYADRSTTDDPGAGTPEPALDEVFGPAEYAVCKDVFVAEQEGDLELDVGDRARVLERIDADWIKGWGSGLISPCVFA